MRWLGLALLAACGGSSKRPVAPEEPRLIPGVTARWFRSSTPCAQGPFELELPVGEAKYGQELELQLKTPRKVAMHVVVLDADRELVTDDATIDASGRASGPPDNTRCVADARERLAYARAGGTSSATSTSVPQGTVAQPAATTAVSLVPTDEVVAGVTVLQLRIPDGAAKIRVRLWSVEPNDLDGVLVGMLHIVWHPNVAEADYEAWVHRPRPVVVAPPPRPVIVKATAPAPVHHEDDERARRDAEIRAEQRRHFCNAHPDDRGCWGPGGMKMKLAFDAHRGEREAYCQVHREDARCWTDAEFTRIRDADHARVLAAQTPSKPTTPPPAPLAETQPPKLSLHAEWRPGYWHWIENTWVWLAGQWRVPEQDIIAEQTTTAPAAPPAPQAEAPPAPPVQAAVWIAGFWQWSGATWIWVPGSWQLRPSATVTWRATTWQPRGAVHILIPGGWVRR